MFKRKSSTLSYTYGAGRSSEEDMFVVILGARRFSEIGAESIEIFEGFIDHKFCLLYESERV